MALAMAGGVIVARRLGPELRGYYGLIVFTVNMLITIGQFGVGYSVAYFTGKKRYSSSQILSFITVCAIVQGTVFGGIFFLAYPHVPSKWTDISRPVMAIGLAALPFAFLHNYIIRMLLAWLKVMQSNIATLLKNLFYLIFVFILLWLMRGSLPAAATSLTLSIIIAGVLSLLFLRGIKPTLRPPGSMFGESARYGLKIYLVFLLTFFSMRLNVFFIQHYLTPSDLSFYQIAGNVTERLWLMPNALSTVLYHTLLSYDKRSSLLTAKVCRNNLFITTLIALLVLGVAKFAIKLLYGEAYLPTAYALYSMLWGIVIYPVFKILFEDFAAHNRLGPGLTAASLGVVANFSLNLFLIPRYGIVGAGIATSLSYTIMAAVMVIFYIRDRASTVGDLLIVKREDFTNYREALGRMMKRFRGHAGENRV